MPPKTFHDKVIAVVRSIPPGKVMSYKEVARLAGSPRAFRAVGGIMSHNTDPTVPCHRVVRADGRPGGYNGLQTPTAGSAEKVRLLQEEGVDIQ